MPLGALAFGGDILKHSRASVRLAGLDGRPLISRLAGE